MIKSLLVKRHVLTCVWIDIESFQIVSIDETIYFIMSIIASIILEALSIEILSEGCI
jgi:hypothetical protein